MLQNLKILKCDETGVTALEYGLIAALIAVATIGAVSALGTDLSATFASIAGKLVGLGT